ncbi:MAG: DUF805 domain-containing protein [Treponema sp.]|jgi:uncharacterized membrane protein YhaH (DUF805 family)|nr:DUF805 domain-containing protein [Treponema sp.]
MAFCVSCGQQLDDEVRFCSGCGKEKDSATQPQNLEQVQNVQTQSVPLADNFTLWQGYVSAWKNFGVGRGRARRKEYWGFVLFNIIFSIGASILDVIIFRKDFSDFGLLYSLYALATFIPGITIAIRRLHDTNRRGTLLFWWGYAPLLAFIAAVVFAIMNLPQEVRFYLSYYGWEYMMGYAIGNSFPLFILLFLFILTGGIVLLVLCCLDSTPGDNRFGPNPKGK